MKEKIKKLLNFIKENWFKLGLLVILIVSIAGAFYWFEWRPNQIRHNCSWIKKHSDARPGSTQEQREQYDKCMQERDRCMIDNKEKFKNSPSGDRLDYKKLMESIQLSSSCLCIPPSPAEPAKDWLERASKNEYDFCVHEKGL